MAKVTIKINPKTAAVSFDIDGVSGTSCTELTAALTRGKEVESQQLKAAYYDPQNLPHFEGEAPSDE